MAGYAFDVNERRKKHAHIAYILWTSESGRNTETPKQI